MASHDDIWLRTTVGTTENGGAKDDYKNSKIHQAQRGSSTGYAYLSRTNEGVILDPWLKIFISL